MVGRQTAKSRKGAIGTQDEVAVLRAGERVEPGKEIAGPLRRAFDRLSARRRSRQQRSKTAGSEWVCGAIGDRGQVGVAAGWSR